MKKSILDLAGVNVLTINEQKAIKAGNNEHLCCLSNDWPPEVYGCYDYFLC